MNAPRKHQQAAPQTGDVLVVSENLMIPLSEFEFSYSRSGGPGGQNVNKVNTKAHLRWVISESPSLNPEQRERFQQKFQQRITRDGEVLIVSQESRQQKENVFNCLEKLRQMLHSVAEKPRLRKATRPTAASREARLQNKRERSQRKQTRSESRRRGWND